MTSAYNNPFAPTDRMLRQFSVIWIFFVGAIALRQEFHYHHIAVAMGLALLAITIGPLGLIKPRLIKPIFVGLVAVTYPIGWVVSHVILALIFYMIFTPLALVFRLVGRDPLKLKPNRETRSYWHPKKRLDKSQYLRQS